MVKLVKAPIGDVMTIMTNQWRKPTAAAAMTLTLFCLTTATASAQIGVSKEGLSRLWGQPVSSDISPSGTGTCDFFTNGLAITAWLIDGYVHKTTFRQPGLAATNTALFLELSGEGQSWRQWRQRSPVDSAELTLWARADDNAMAVHRTGELTVSTRQWNLDNARKPNFEQPATPAASVAATPEEPSAPPAVAQSNDLAIAQSNTLAVALPPPEEAPAPPPPKPTPPADLPAKGSSKAVVLEKLGSPTGTMTMSAREAWLYPWGTVWLIKDKVHRIEP
jgi:hypothetical protein